jgi:hypothetical protein
MKVKLSEYIYRIMRHEIQQQKCKERQEIKLREKYLSNHGIKVECYDCVKTFMIKEQFRKDHDIGKKTAKLLKETNDSFMLDFGDKLVKVPKSVVSVIE